MMKALSALLLLLGGAIALVWWQTQAPLPPAAPIPMPSEPAPAPAPAPVTAPEPAVAAPAEATDSEKEKLVFEVKSEGDLMFVLRELGMDDVEGEMATWAVKRGYPEYDQSGNYLLDQPYQQYDDDTLLGLAESGDMWAQQLLAKRLVGSRPGDAMQWYERAAASGSVYAMQELANLHYRSARKATRAQLKDAEGREQLDAIKGESPEVTAYAWLAAAERSGWDPTRAASTVSLVSRRLSDEQVAEACTMAEDIRSGLQSQRQSQGLGAYDLTPPPLLVAPGEWGGTTSCYEEEQAYDLSQCQEAAVVASGVSTDVWICGER